MRALLQLFTVLRFVLYFKVISRIFIYIFFISFDVFAKKKHFLGFCYIWVMKRVFLAIFQFLLIFLCFYVILRSLLKFYVNPLLLLFCSEILSHDPFYQGFSVCALVLRNFVNLVQFFHSVVVFTLLLSNYSGCYPNIHKLVGILPFLLNFF